MSLSRENIVATVAALMLVFTGWAWGGVVLWAQWVVFGLGVLSFAIALAPESRNTFLFASPSRVTRLALGLGLLFAIGFIWHDLYHLYDQRKSTLELIPDTIFEPLSFDQWGFRGLLVGIGIALAVLIVAGFLRKSDVRRRLLRFPPFWLGLILFIWIACQALNSWGLIVQRDFIWKLVPQSHVSWLPSGVAAPFDSTEEPGGMNGWRQLLILAGPWSLLCALRAAVLRRRVYAWLAGVAIITGLGVALVGNMARAEKWRDFLGFAVAELKQPPFGPFVYKNHAGAWLYLVLALALALMFYLAKRRGDRVDRGGPHLLVAGAAVLLALGSASTMSFGGSIVALLLLLIIAPVAYLLDAQLRQNLSPVPAIAVVVLGAIVAYAGLLSADAQRWRWKFEKKQAAMERTGEDDRAPLRRVAWAMVTSSTNERQLSGWGAGSFRWVSPAYMAKEQVFLNKNGVLVRRTSHTHNDWLQAIIEWGVMGWLACICVATFLFYRIRRACVQLRAPSLALIGGMVLFACHAWYDFLLFQPQMVLLAVIIPWLIVSEHDDAA